ncbi:MAG: hypothetical protein AAGH64_06750 [Planctomycetota bacterium]
MTLDDLRQLVAKRPFRAFEIELVNSERIRISHPDMIIVPTNKRSQMVPYLNPEGMPTYFNPGLVLQIREDPDAPISDDHAESA